MKVRITLLEPMLGTIPFNREIVQDYIESKNPDGVDEDVIANIPEEVSKMSTGFHRDKDGVPFIFNYMIKGFFKAAARNLKRSGQQKIPAFLKIIDGLIFVYPRQIYTVNPLPDKLDFLERPLRAQTPQGERVCLARSEMIPAGFQMEFEIKIMAKDFEEAVEQWLDYGKYVGLGQWRNASYGTFRWEKVS